MKRVAAYVAQSQDYIQSTDLAKRVRIWHETLGPKLELVEQRGGFDIHEYGSKVLSKFPQDSRKTTIDFCDIGEGNTPEEVSRLFLSSLMLANAQNVEIGCSAPKNEALPMELLFDLEYSVVSIKRTGTLNYFEVFYHPDCFFHVLNEIFAPP